MSFHTYGFAKVTQFTPSVRLILYAVFIVGGICHPMAFSGESISVTRDRLAYGDISFRVSSSMDEGNKGMVEVEVQIGRKKGSKSMDATFAPRVYVKQKAIVITDFRPLVSSSSEDRQLQFSFSVSQSCYADSAITVEVLTKDHLAIEEARLALEKKRKKLPKYSGDITAEMLKAYSALGEESRALRRLTEKVFNQGTVQFEIRLKHWKVKKMAPRAGTLKF